MTEQEIRTFVKLTFPNGLTRNETARGYGDYVFYKEGKLICYRRITSGLLNSALGDFIAIPPEEFRTQEDIFLLLCDMLISKRPIN